MMLRSHLLVIVAVALTITSAADVDSIDLQSPRGDWDNYIASCIVFKDEAPYLREWIEFHGLVGVDHFYMYSNESKDKYKQVLAPYVTHGNVTLHEWETKSWGKDSKQFGTQCDAYKHCLDTYGKRSRWMIFIDVDEFMFPVKREHRKLHQVLREFEREPGLVVRNALYGSSGFVNKPQGPVIENYVFRAPIAEPLFDEREDDVLFHVKSVVDGRRGVGCGKFGAHVIFLDEPSARLVNERHEPHNATGRNAPKGHAYVERIRYNHYKSKSVADWREKKAKGVVQGATAAKKFAKKGNQWDAVNRNDVLDTEIHRFLPELRTRLGLSEGKYPLG